MDKSKTILASIACICFTVAVIFISVSIVYLRYHYTYLHSYDGRVAELKHQDIKNKELEIGIYDQYTYCIKTIMKESRRNSKPCDVVEAEKVCSKLKKDD
jgi:hypothetical protein